MKPFSKPCAGKSYSARDIIPLAAIAGIISAAMLGINFKIGLVLLGLTIGALLGIVRSTRPKRSAQFIRHDVPIKQIFSDYDLTEKVTNPQVKSVQPEHQPVQKDTLAEPLLTALRVRGSTWMLPWSTWETPLPSLQRMSLSRSQRL